MARRKRTSGFEDLITVLARLPWWACLVIALVAWLTLNPIASSPVQVSNSATLDQMGRILASQLLRTCAYFGQYLIPIACVLAAIGSIASHLADRLPGYKRLYDTGNSRPPNVMVVPRGDQMALVLPQGGKMGYVWYYDVGLDVGQLTFQSDPESRGP